MIFLFCFNYDSPQEYSSRILVLLSLLSDYSYLIARTTDIEKKMQMEEKTRKCYHLNSFCKEQVIFSVTMLELYVATSVLSVQ